MNPVILLDEVDKVARLARRSVGSLLEVLDPAQNHSFPTLPRRESTSRSRVHRHRERRGHDPSRC